MDIIQLIIQYLPTAIQYFLAFALLITVVVFIHELGHYSVGRWCGIGVETFSIGMGKQIWGKTDKYGTLWRVAILPIGGYVKFYGDEDPSGKKSEVSENIKDHMNFHNKSVWKKIATTAAGPLFNFILAIFIFSIIFFFRGESLVQPYVGQIVDESPAYNSGLEAGDEIIYADTKEILYFNDLRDYVLENPENEIELTVIRDGVEKKIFLTPEVVSSKDRFGETGKAYDFNGNAYINFNFQTSSDNTFSWNFWIKDDSTSNAYRRWLTTTNSGHLSNTVNVREESNGKMALYANGLYFQTSQQNFWKNGNWHMITVVSDGYKTKLYYDSIFLGEVNGSVTPEDGLYAGGYFGDGEYLQGSMDDIRVYKNALSPSDIKQLYDLERVSELPEEFSGVTLWLDASNIDGQQNTTLNNGNKFNKPGSISIHPLDL